MLVELELIGAGRGILAPYFTGRSGSRVRTAGVVILEQRLLGRRRCVLADVAADYTCQTVATGNFRFLSFRVHLVASCQLHIALARGPKPGYHHSHQESASSCGPVETGFRKAVVSPLYSLAAVLHSRVAKMVLPTSVLAP